LLEVEEELDVGELVGALRLGAVSVEGLELGVRAVEWSSQDISTMGMI
jgi:hypothetical protein